MKYQILNDVKTRKYIAKTHQYKMYFLLLAKNQILNKKVRQASFLKFLNNFEKKNKSITKIKNRCLITGKPRAVFRRFKITRNIFKLFAGTGLLPGIYKQK